MSAPGRADQARHHLPQRLDHEAVDSFPGLLAQITGGTSKSTGIFYDDSYDRTLFASGTNCTVGPGTEMNIAEPVDTDLHGIDGGVPAALTGLNSGVAISPNNLPAQLAAATAILSGRTI